MIYQDGTIAYLQRFIRWHKKQHNGDNELLLEVPSARITEADQLEINHTLVLVDANPTESCKS
jgi:hypothetical protein